MAAKRLLWLAMVCAGTCAGTGLFAASQVWGAPWDKVVAKRPEADPEKTYELSEENGPWMILAVTFMGDDAEQQARELVLELRKRHKLQAYCHRVKVDFDKAEGQAIDKYGSRQKMRYQRGNVAEEIAVLVGNYPSVDDETAQHDLKKIIWKLKPECLEVKEGMHLGRPNAALRMLQQTVGSGFVDEKKSGYVQNVKQDRGPMGSAFIVTNPILPRDYFVRGGIDDSIVALNKNRKYSLLKCPGRYTVRVATFNGRTVIDPRKVEAIEKKGAKMPSQLEEAEKKARKLTDALRGKGVEAYEFHDEFSSMVCVGSFNTLGNQLPDGRLDLAPAIVKIMATYGAEKSPGSLDSAPQFGQPKQLLQIPYDLQPVPIEVPRPSPARALSRVD